MVLYAITLSPHSDDWDRIQEYTPTYGDWILLAHERGKEDTHDHYHGIIESQVKKTSNLRDTMSARYKKNIDYTITRINLVIKTITDLQGWVNYCMKDNDVVINLRDFVLKERIQRRKITSPYVAEPSVRLFAPWLIDFMDDNEVEPFKCIHKCFKFLQKEKVYIIPLRKYEKALQSQIHDMYGTDYMLYPDRCSLLGDSKCGI